MEEFILYLEDNLELAKSVFGEYYDERATELGEEMYGDERLGGSGNFDEDPLELYEMYSHTTGHEAHYYGAMGVIRELGTQSGFDVSEDDEELQWEILVLLDKEV